MIYIILGLTKFKLISPLFTIYLLNKGFSFSEIVLGGAVYHITACITEVPLGVFMDKAGTKVSFIVSNILYIVKIMLFFKVSSTLGLLAMYSVRAVGKSLIKKCDIVIVGNKLENEGKSERLSKVYGNIVSISSGMLVASSVICGLFYDGYLRYIVLATIVMHLVSTLLTILYYNEPLDKSVRSMGMNFKEYVDKLIEGYRHVRVNGLIGMFILLSVITLARIVIVDMKSVLMSELMISTWIVSAISIIGELNQVAMGKLSHKVITKMGNYTVYLPVSLIGVFSIIPIISSSKLIVLMYCFTPIFNGLKNIYEADELNKNTTMVNKGTVISFILVIQSILTSVVMVIMGKLHSTYGVVSIFIAVAAFIGLVVAPLSIKYVNNKQVNKLNALNEV